MKWHLRKLIVLFKINQSIVQIIIKKKLKHINHNLNRLLIKMKIRITKMD